MTKFLGIVIVNYNSSSLLKDCVESVLKSELNGVRVKIAVVDNNSRDNSLDFLINLQNDTITLIKNNKNMGFGYACNQGVNALGIIDYLLFLNPDTVVFNSSFAESLIFLNNNQNISILGVKHIDEQGNVQLSCSRTPTPRRIISDIFGFSKVFPKLFKPATLMSDFNHEDSKLVDQVMGAYMLMKKEIFNEIGGFDTRFFVYYEDADFALRAKKKGLLSYYNSNIEILHHGRGTTKSISHIALFYNLRSRIQFTYKHYGDFSGFLILFLTLFVEPITRCLYNLVYNRSENINTVKAFKLLYQYILKR